ncbi:iron-sulfur cluster repair di-iron protein [Pedobacter changchengzhani]|uniref:Iron-sulfur cluster repair di-iron protein n=1 Tax=Pedobacter changchengzhani TaxID=2529274 RepID=A0A4V3A003_9SPHI|nr:iron-sulfur cluster repair di-iron protein [Pedobacter changchengzhani]TDG35023.1 iron-sulfur cluster repair di-iron protein [Pedobacter changchengzhani]
MEATLENILDVTVLDPRVKHPTIFQHYDALEEGESLTIHNDHDPKPLYYQLLGERGNVFTWEYLEDGPELWRVKIRKNITGECEETLGEIAVKDLRKAEIFKKYGLDFCCGGKKTVKEACADKGLDVTKVEQELQQLDKVQLTKGVPYDAWPIDFLADYIVNTHHSYVKKSIPDLLAYSKKIMQVHGSGHSELTEVYELTKSVANELTEHMVSEETILFPYVKELVKADKNSVLNEEKIASIAEMEAEHDAVGRMLERIRLITNNYALPADSCASYALTFKLLQDFEDDLFLHIHLENNILFPKMIKLQESLKN